MGVPEKEGIPASMPLAASTEKMILVPRNRFSGWALGVKVLLLALLLAALGAKILISLLFEVLDNPDFSFLFLAVPLLILFLYVRRNTFSNAIGRPETAGLSLVVLACLIFIAGRASAELFSTRFSLILILAGLIWTFAGRRALRAASLPLLLLWCFIPPPAIVYNALSNPVRDVLVKIASAAAQLLGLSFYADGGSVNAPGLSVNTADICGGLHVIPALVISAVMILLLLSYGEVMPRGKAIGFALLTAFVAALAAAVAIALRMVLWAMLANRGPGAANSFYHATQGWAIFLIGLLAAFTIASMAARRFEKRISR